MLDSVISALGLSTDEELERLVGRRRGAAYHWRRAGIPAHLRFEFARRIQNAGRELPDGLLDPQTLPPGNWNKRA